MELIDNLQVMQKAYAIYDSRTGDNIICNGAVTWLSAAAAKNAFQAAYCRWDERKGAFNKQTRFVVEELDGF